MRVKLDCNNLGGRIARGDGRRFAARRGAAIQQARAFAYQRGNKLRSFILYEHASLAERVRLRDVAAGDRACGRQQRAWREGNTVALQLGDNGVVIYAD